DAGGVLAAGAAHRRRGGSLVAVPVPGARGAAVRDDGDLVAGAAARLRTNVVGGAGGRAGAGPRTVWRIRARARQRARGAKRVARLALGSGGPAGSCLSGVYCSAMNDHSRDSGGLVFTLIGTAEAVQQRLEAVLEPFNLSLAKLGILHHLAGVAEPVSLS